MKDVNSLAQSSYKPDDAFFDDYDTTQLRSILRHRRDVFKPESLAGDVIPLVAAFGSQPHGVSDFERRGKGRGREAHMHFSLSEDLETILETIREDSRFADLAYENVTISAVVSEHMKKFQNKN